LDHALSALNLAQNQAKLFLEEFSWLTESWQESSQVLSFRLIPLQQWNLNTISSVLEIEKLLQIGARRFLDNLFRELLTPNSTFYKSIESQFETSMCQ
jgi:hypothetical protein